MSNESKDEFHKITDVAKRFGVTRCTIWNWATKRGLKMIRIGGVKRIRESDLQAFIARTNRSKQPAAT